MKNLLRILSSFIAATVSELASAKETERVVLWLGERRSNDILVRDVFVPAQHAEADYFHIPKHGMEQLFRTLRSRRWMVAAQVHSHPEEAFHSPADDRWAIIRHVGALSLVVPRFCQETTLGTFMNDAMVYQLTEDNEFVRAEPVDTYEITT